MGVHNKKRSMKKAKPKVSIIVPVYNTKDFIYDCLDSLVNQTYKNIEIVIVDDGSNDGSDMVCQEYQEKYGNIVFVSKENGGLSSARNYGIKHSSGDYITFVDSDDYLNPDSIEILVDMMIKYNAEISIGLKVGHELINEEIKVLDGKTMLMHLLNNSTFEAWGKIFRRDLWINSAFPENRIHEDLYVMPDIFQRCNHCVMYQGAVYNYRVREDSIMGTLLKTQLKDLIECCLHNIKTAKMIDKDFLQQYQKWYFYHILWYFYNVLCNIEKKESAEARKNVALFYKKTLLYYWGNPYVKLQDKFRFVLIAIFPGIVMDYNNRKYSK